MSDKIEMTKEELTSFVKNALQTVITEKGLDKIDVKHRIDPAEDEKKQLEMNPKYRMGKFVKALLSNSVEAITKAADPNNETTTTEGGYLVPDVTRAEILRIAETFGQVRPYCRVIPMGKAKVMNVPVENGGITTYWVNENGSITSSKATLTQVTLTAKKQGAIAVWTSELAEDSIVDVGNYINYLVGKGFAKEEDSQLCVGDGTTFAGLFHTTHTFNSGSIPVASADQITYDNLVDLMANIDQAKVIGASLFMHRTVLGSVKKIKDDNGLPIFYPANSGKPAELMGVPVVTFEYAPNASVTTPNTPLIIYGNLNNAIIGSKNEITALFTNTAVVDGTSTFQNDLQAIRFLRRMAFVFAQPSECNVIKIQST